nr:hypothetical protein [Microcella flavibacter]
MIVAVTRPVAEEGAERDRVRHGDERREDERRPERAERVGLGPGVVARVEDAGEGDDGEQEQDRVGDHRGLVDEQHELVPEDHDDDHDEADEAVDHRAQADRVGHAEEPAHAADEGVAADPDRDRVERDGRQQREERADDAAAHAEERAGGDGVVRAGARAEEPHRHEEEDADGDAEQHGRDGLPEREPERDRQRAEQHGGEGVRAAELDAHEVDPGRGAVGVGDGVDAALLDLRRARAALRVVSSERTTTLLSVIAVLRWGGGRMTRL